MEKLQKQIEVSIEERMGELKQASKHFIEDQNTDLAAVYTSTMEYMRQMITDVEELLKMSSAISRRQELLEIDDFEKKEMLNGAFEKILKDLESMAESGYEKFLQERSFEED